MRASLQKSKCSFGLGNFMLHMNVSICLSHVPLLLVLFIAFEARCELDKVPAQFRSRYYTRLLAGWIYSSITVFV